MIILIGSRDTILYEESLRSNMAVFTSELLREGKITGCLAALPTEKEARRWLFSFLDSLKCAGGGRVGVLLLATAATETDFAECDAAGLDEVVIVQGSENPETVIGALLNYRRANPDNGLGFRVWLDPDAGGYLQRKAGAWKRAVPWLLSMELTPLSWASAAHDSAPQNGKTHKNGNQPLACDWLRSAITISCSGSVTPCPQHSPRDGVSLATNSAAQVIAKIDDWHESLGAHPVCRSCHSLARFSIPGWMKDGSNLTRETKARESFVRYDDLIGRNVGSVSEEERESLLADFAGRVRAMIGGSD